MASPSRAMADLGNNFAAEMAVVGGGPAGLVTAIALATAGAEVIVIAPPATADHRTTALLGGSVTALAMLEVWPRCSERAAPLRSIRLIDDTKRLIRAPEVVFAAAEIGLEAFGYNIENRDLLAALEARAGELKLRRVFAAAVAIEPAEKGVTIRHPGGAVCARIAIGADGQRSLCRNAAGIGTVRRAYPQVALTVNLGHARPHRETSTEFHTETGPFTLVPLPGNRSSLVCVLDPATADAVAALPDEALAAEVERRAHSLLGAMRVEGGRGSFPLAVETASTFVANRIALVGEAAHVVPPIGAQGLNLGLRDAATLVEIMADARRQGCDPGSAQVLERYQARRRADALSRTIAVDLLNRSLLTGFLPAHAMRGLSLYMVDHIAPLRRALMREGVAPMASQPRLMRGERP